MIYRRRFKKQSYPFRPEIEGKTPCLWSKLYYKIASKALKIRVLLVFQGRLSILYKDIFYTKTYAEARHYVESLKIFADQKYADLDTDDFEVREKKDEKGRINHSFFCKFIKEENVYLSRATAKTITSMFLESTFAYPKQNLYESNLMTFPVHFTRYDMPEDIKKLLDFNVEKLEKAHLSQELKTYLSSTLENLYL